MRKYIFFPILTVLLEVTAIAQGEELKFTTYEVKKGETCTSIAKKFYGDVHAYDNIHKYNDLSASNYACLPGQVLKLPILPEAAEAELTSRFGEVRAKSPKISWKNVEVGAEFYPAWRVNTLERSSAELGFRNQTTLQMSENTLVVIYGPGKTETAVQSVGRATVERGRLKTFLGSLNDKPMVVETPSAKATLMHGDQQITVDENEESRFANHEGEPLKVCTLDGKGEVTVGEGYGSRVKKNKRPEKPRKLPEAPTWAPDLATRALVLTEKKAHLKAAWNAVPQVEGYRVELSRDKRQLDLVFSQNVPAKITQVELRDLPAGNYYLSVVSVDEAKFESLPSKILKIGVNELTVRKNQRIKDEGESKVLLGTTFYPPKKNQCVLKNNKEKDLTVRSKDQNQVNCKDDTTETSVNFEVVIPKVREHERVKTTEGGTSLTEIEITPEAPDKFSVDGPKGLKIKAVKIDQKKLRLALTPQNIQPGDYEVKVLTYGHELGRVPVNISEPKPSEQLSMYPQVFTTLVVGYDAMQGVDAGSPLGAGVELGGGIIANQFMALELRLGYGIYARTRGAKPHDGVDQLLSVRIHGMFGWMVEPLAIYGMVGGVWRGFLRQPAEHRSYGSVGGGIMVPLLEKLQFTVEADCAISPMQGGVEYLPEVRFGLRYIIW